MVTTERLALPWLIRRNETRSAAGTRCPATLGQKRNVFLTKANSPPALRLPCTILALKSSGIADSKPRRGYCMPFKHFAGHCTKAWYLAWAQADSLGHRLFAALRNPRFPLLRYTREQTVRAHHPDVRSFFSLNFTPPRKKSVYIERTSRKALTRYRRAFGTNSSMLLC